MYVPSQKCEGIDEEFQWEVYGMNRFDERIEEFVEKVKSGIMVESIEADYIGGVKVFFSGNYLLEIYPDSSSTEELWRILVPEI